MFKKSLTYKDWNGVERTEEFRFNLSKTDIQLLDAKHPGGLFNYMKSCYEAMDVPKMMDFFVMLIMESYGVVSEDGRRFEKSPELSKAFSETRAFDEIFQWLYNEKGAVNEFLVKVMPEDLSSKISEALNDAKSLPEG